MLPKVISVLLLFLACSNLYSAVEPRQEYEKPGFKSGHAYDGIIPEETVNLFTGGLTISQRDVPLKNYKPYEDFQQLITRFYSSKIFRQNLSPSCSDSVAMSQTIEDEFVGLGWTLHFGRLWDASSNNPVLELPDGTRHMFYADSFNPNRKISKSIWILQSGFDTEQNAAYFDVTSPGNPDTAKMRFYDYPDNRYEDFRGPRHVIHASHWFAYCSNAVACAETMIPMRITYGRDQSGLLWPQQVQTTCGGSIDPVVFNWDTQSTKPRLNSITFPWITGPITVFYTYLEQNGHILLETFTSPEGKKYKYEYYSTNELKKITVSTDSNITPTDLTIEYVYATHEFKINQFFLASACTRVVTQKKVSNPAGGIDTWNYTYPSLSDPTHKVTVIEPRQHKREVTFQGYSTIDPYVWFVGNSLKDETFQFNSGNYNSLKQINSTYISAQVSTALDPEASNLDSVKIPVVSSTTVVYPETGQQATTTYLNYDRFGNVGEIQEANFSGGIFRKTQYQYEHSNGDGDDSLFEDNNFIRGVTSNKVLNSGGQTASEIKYDYHNATSDDGQFGLLSKSQTWDSESSSFIDKYFYYNQPPINMRHLEQISEEHTPGSRNTYFNISCNFVNFVWDDLVDQAGDLFAGHAWPNGDNDWHWVYKDTFSPNAHKTSYTYDKDQRLTSITPPAGDVTNINYNDSSRQVTVTQGAASTTETYDANLRLKERQVSIASGQNSYQIFVYDALNNLTSESEKKLVIPVCSDNNCITRTYDAFNRLTSVTNADSFSLPAVTYNYNGPDLTVTQLSESGNLNTRMKYDSAGRLISVTEPNNTRTSYAYDVLDRLTMVCHNDNDDICDIGSTFKRTFVYSTRGKLLSETHPESGTTTYVYDLLGRVKQKKFAGMSTPIIYTYDLRDRVTNINYPTDTDASFYYDGAVVPGYPTQTYTYPKSHLTGMVDAAGTTLWHQFSVHEAVEKKTVILDVGFPYDIQYHYDSRANLDWILYPSGNKVFIPRNNANAISQIQRQFGPGPQLFLLDQINYNAALLPSLFDFANGVDLSITSDVRNRPDVMSSPGKLSLDYNYNVRSLINQITTSQNGSPNQPRSITYDNLGRIATFTHFGNPTLNYNFDIYGNLLSKTGALSEGPYTYTNNRINGVPYTQPGSQLTANGKTLTYNEENQLKTVTGTETTTYTYDGKGNRAKASSPSGGNRRFIYDENGTLLVEIKKSILSFVEKEYINGPSGTLVTANYEEQRAQFSEDFNDGIADFTVSLGNWAVVSQAYNAQASGTNWAISNACITCTGCVIKADALSVNQTGNKNAFVIYDFVSNTNFKYAGLDVTAGKWVIGDVISGTRTDRAFSTASPPVAGTWYSIEVKFIGNAVYLKVGGITRVVYSFASINPSRFALAVQGGQSNFDNVSTILPYSKSFVHQENFDDGVANGYTVVAGVWSVLFNKYETTVNQGQNQYISKSPTTGFNAGTIELDCQLVNNGICHILFDYTNATNYKFAGVNTTLNRWELGRVVNGSTSYIATQTGASGNINYHFRLLLETSATATLVYNNAIKVQGTYSGSFTTGLVALYTNQGQYKFDNVEVYTDGAGVYVPSYGLGTFYYHLNDHLGSTRILTDKNGAFVASLEFYPFGETKQSFGCSNFIDQRFTGKLLDSESGLQYFGARYLSNDLTRFTSIDPLRASARTESPQSWNRYAYSFNNPLTFQDPTGLDPQINPNVGSYDVAPTTNFQSSNPTANSLLTGLNGIINTAAHLTNSVSNVLGFISDAAPRAILEKVGFSEDEAAFAMILAAAVTPTKAATTMDDAIAMGVKFVKEGGVMEVTGGGKNFQFRNTFKNALGEIETLIARFDVNPADPHVKKSGAHMNLERQVNGKVKQNKHIPVDSSTVRKGDHP